MEVVLALKAKGSRFLERKACSWRPVRAGCWHTGGRQLPANPLPLEPTEVPVPQCLPHRCDRGTFPRASPISMGLGCLQETPVWCNLGNSNVNSRERKLRKVVSEKGGLLAPTSPGEALQELNSFISQTVTGHTCCLAVTCAHFFPPG